jgi:hypothetical protein
MSSVATRIQSTTPSIEGELNHVNAPQTGADPVRGERNYCRYSPHRPRGRATGQSMRDTAWRRRSRFFSRPPGGGRFSCTCSKI